LAQGNNIAGDVVVYGEESFVYGFELYAFIAVEDDEFVEFADSFDKFGRFNLMLLL
jgi:ABC-type glucose/galactose transport system permease subunit